MSMRPMPGPGMPPPGVRQGGVTIGDTAGRGQGPAVAGYDGGPSSDPVESSESIHDALARYGLKLESRKGPLEIVIVDQIDTTPTEN